MSDSAASLAANWQESCLPIPAAEWQRINKFDPRGAALADEHYSRRKVGGIATRKHPAQQPS